MATKQCSRCMEHLDVVLFNKKLNKLQSRCRECSREIQWKIRYGVTKEQYEAMLLEQAGVCAICRRSEPRYTGLSVDHDHSCCPGKKSCGQCVRGLLCSNCNPMIGYAGETPLVLRDAASYLERYKNG